MSPPPSSIIYALDTDIRFGDLDPYGHLNAKHYVDLVASTRLLYLDRHLGHSLETLTERGLGFYLRSAVQHFHRPVTGVRRIHIRSWVEAASGASLPVVFQILSQDQGELFAEGTLHYVLVNLKTQRPTKTPPWLTALFTHPS